MALKYGLRMDRWAGFSVSCNNPKPMIALGPAPHRRHGAPGMGARSDADRPKGSASPIARIRLIRQPKTPRIPGRAARGSLISGPKPARTRIGRSS